MKKTYIIPETLIVSLNVKASILQTSDLGGAGQVAPGTPGEVKEDVSTDAGSTNVWDEEW